MKQLFRILLAVGAFMLTTQIVACSCEKKAGGGGNNNSDGGNGGDEPTPPSIEIENIDASVAEVKDGTNIELKASGFPTVTIIGPAADGTIQGSSILTVRNADQTQAKRAFDLIIKGTGGVAATAGLVFVSTGDKPNANAFTITGITTENALGARNATAYTPDQQQEGGPLMTAPRATDGINGEVAVKTGWTFYGVFMNDAAPTSAAEAAANASPFSFTGTAGANATRPILFCQAIVTTVTAPGRVGGVVNTDPGSPRDDTVLTGGQKASCYVGAVGAAFTGAAATGWLNAAASDTFKKKFDIAVAGVRTDEKTFSNMGFTGDGKAVLRDGLLTTAQMTSLTAANDSAFKKFSITIVP